MRGLVVQPAAAREVGDGWTGGLAARAKARAWGPLG